MSHTPWRVRIILAVLLSAWSFAYVSDGLPSAGAQVAGQDMLTIRVSVAGDAPSGFTIYEECFPGTSVPPPAPPWGLRFGFDATGHPTTAYAPQTAPSIVGDAWVVPIGPGPEDSMCRFAEVTDSPPTSLAWTCASTVSPPPPSDNPDPSAPQVFGCLSPRGSGADPVLFAMYDAPTNQPPQLYTQTVDVTFANTFASRPPASPPQSVAAIPAFTG